VDVDKALVLSKEVMKLESPDERMSEAHRCALKDVASDEQAKLVGAEDLVALKPPADQDVVSRTLRNHWPFPSTVSLVPGAQHLLLHQLIGTGISIPRARQNPVFPRAPPGSSVKRIVGPILALNFTTSPNARLGIAIPFIAVFATGLELSTGVSRDTIFVVTATYSAVLVMYVSGNLGDVGGPGSALESSGNATSLS
jgi:hypothetical protein